MNIRRTINMVVLILGVVGALYYSAANKEDQGAVVLLLGILYFLALPYITQEHA